jgi:ABC-2 type transport system permease protein
MTAIAHSYYLMGRLLRQLLRQPWWIALSIVQPIIWLVFYGQLFQKVVTLPGFHATSYIDFLTPGIVTMSALFSSGWSGMGMISDLDRGVMDRFLVSPVSRVAIIGGRLMNLVVSNVSQSLILIVLGLILGARYQGGIVGVAVLVVCAALLAIPIAAMSIALALTLRKMESIIGATNFVLLPIMFLSPALMARGLMPHWMQVASHFNPVNWCVEAGRGALLGQADWPIILLQIGCLALFGALGAMLAARAFRSYQRSV